MDHARLPRLSAADLDAEAAVPLPAKEVMSLLNLDLNVDLALDLAAPIDLAVAANANIAAPINGAVGANVLSSLSDAEVLGDQAVSIDQGVSGEAIANGLQDAGLDQGDDTVTPEPVEPTDGSGAGSGDEPVADPTDPGSVLGVLPNGALSGDLLDVNVDVALDSDIAAPIAGAVALNANVAAPINAAVGANLLSIDSDATAIAQQTAVITQRLDGVVAEATAEQTAELQQ
jgi:hypothetical protein